MSSNRVYYKCLEMSRGRMNAAKVPFFQKYSSTQSRYVRFRRCGTCLALFPSIQLLQEHVVLHKGQVPYLCCVCGGNWVNEVMLRHHQKEHRLGKKHSCVICDGPRHSFETYNLQLRKYQCGTCGEHFKYKELYEQHSLNHHRNAPSYSCTRCKILFTEWEDFTDHFGRAHLHANNSQRYTPSYTCSICRNKSSGVSSLKTHFFLIHKTHDVTMCYDCLSGFCCPPCFEDHLHLHRKVYIWVGNVDDYLPAGSCNHSDINCKTKISHDDAPEVIDLTDEDSVSSFVASKASVIPRKIDKRYPPEMYWPRDNMLVPKNWNASMKLQAPQRNRYVSTNNFSDTSFSDAVNNNIYVKSDPSSLQLESHFQPIQPMPQIVMQPQPYDQPLFVTQIPNVGIDSTEYLHQQRPLTVQADAVVDPTQNYIVVQTDGGTLLFPITANEHVNATVNSGELMSDTNTTLTPSLAAPRNEMVKRNLKLETKFLELLTILLGSELVDSLDLTIDNLPFQLQIFLSALNVDPSGDHAEELIMKFLHGSICSNDIFQDVADSKNLSQLIEDMLRLSENWKIIELPAAR